MTHKSFDVPEDNLYLPLHVGRNQADDLGYLGDNTGDNISIKNCYYSELTGLYWIWKNYHKSQYVGTCHYRRYLLNKDGFVFNEAELENILTQYDVITPKLLELNHSYYDGFSTNHNLEDLIATEKVIQELYPQYYNDYKHIVHENRTYFGNIMICSKKLFDDYCQWLFDILFEVEKIIDVSSYDEYHRRVFGFISELLLYVWIYHNKLTTYECIVGIIGEKAETKEVKQALSQYFSNKNYLGAKEYFLEYKKKRPDILMEASDTFRELRTALQIISTCEYEMDAYNTCILDHITDFALLIQHFNRMNQAICHKLAGYEIDEDLEFLNNPLITKEAIQISNALYSPLFSR